MSWGIVWTTLCRRMSFCLNAQHLCGLPAGLSSLMDGTLEDAGSPAAVWQMQTGERRIANCLQTDAQNNGCTFQREKPRPYSEAGIWHKRASLHLFDLWPAVRLFTWWVICYEWRNKTAWAEECLISVYAYIIAIMISLFCWFTCSCFLRNTSLIRETLCFVWCENLHHPQCLSIFLRIHTLTFFLE